MTLDIAQLADYGGVGIFALGLIAVVLYLVKDRDKVLHEAERVKEANEIKLKELSEQVWREVQRSKDSEDLRYTELLLKHDILQGKYEALLVEIGKMHGKVDTEIDIDSKLGLVLEEMRITREARRGYDYAKLPKPKKKASNVSNDT